MKKLTNKAVKSLPINLPSIAIQRIIVDALNVIHAETKRLESLHLKKLLALEELKQSLLHQAFTDQLSRRLP